MRQYAPSFLRRGFCVSIAFTPRKEFAGNTDEVGLSEKNGRLLLAERIEDPAARADRVREVLDALAPTG